MDNIELLKNDSCQGVFFLKQTGKKDENSASLDLSRIKIIWRRTGDDNLFNHTAPLGYLPIGNSQEGINVKIELPSKICFQEPFSLGLVISNGTDNSS